MQVDILNKCRSLRFGLSSKKEKRIKNQAGDILSIQQQKENKKTLYHVKLIKKNTNQLYEFFLDSSGAILETSRQDSTIFGGNIDEDIQILQDIMTHFG